ncbi:MAG: glycosyltransferase family 4 protein, partial [Moorea sp. SIO3C2]|nr:glycosyltransferase family 4 protein [Moorena sp. SIO3C2]
FYLWHFGVVKQVDPEFQATFQWDLPLLEGYDYEFVDNVSPNPGTHHFWGLQNPTLVQQVQSFKPDAVVLMSYNYASLYRFMLQWDNRKVPLLFRGDSHRLLPRKGFKEWLRQQWIAGIYRRFNAILYVGKANFQYFTYHGVPSNQLFFSPHAVDNQRFIDQTEEAQKQAEQLKVELGIPAEHRVILFAGKFTKKKRPWDLLNAFLQAKLEQVSLLLVGTGPLEVHLKTVAQPHHHIYFTPFQNQSMMPRTYAIGDVLVLPSYGSGETWGLAINEAMCLGKPIIVSDHVGCAQDLVQPGQNGLVFPAGDVSGLSTVLQEAFSDLPRLKAWGDRSREIIYRYSYTQATEGLEQTLDFLQKSGTGNREQGTVEKN